MVPALAPSPWTQPLDPDGRNPRPLRPKVIGVRSNATARFKRNASCRRGSIGLPRVHRRRLRHRGRRGVLSDRIAVRSVAPPAAPASNRSSYDEEAVAVSWTPVDAAVRRRSPTAYLRTNRCSGADGLPNKCSCADENAVGEPRFIDPARLGWEEERCSKWQRWRNARRRGVESSASLSRCVTLHDTLRQPFPRARQRHVQGRDVSDLDAKSRGARYSPATSCCAVAPATRLGQGDPGTMVDTTSGTPFQPVRT